MDNKIILYDDKNSAKFVKNIKGWVNINGKFFGNSESSEHRARYSSCTHKKCDCGNIMGKEWAKCESCRSKSEIEWYIQLPFEEYTGEMVYSYYADEYFRDSGEIEDYCHDNKVDFKELRLVLCIPNKFWKIDAEYWEDIMPENSDGELPKELNEALKIFNKVISGLPPVSYSPSRTRTEYKTE